MRCKSQMLSSAVPTFNREALSYLRKERQDCYSYRVLKGIGAERTLLMNGMALRVLSLCNGKNTVSDIARQIAALFHDVSQERICNDVNFALLNLSSQGLLQWRTPTPWIPQSNFVVSVDDNLMLAICDEDSESAVFDFLERTHAVDLHTAGVTADPLLCGCETFTYQEFMVAAVRKKDHEILAVLSLSLGIPEDESLYLSLSVSRIIARTIGCASVLPRLLKGGLHLVVETLAAKLDLAVCRTWVPDCDDNKGLVKCLQEAGFSQDGQAPIGTSAGGSMSFTLRM
jgi:hypothetical protein